MEVLPVLDLLNGVVVRGVAGRRSEYRPLQTRLTTSIQPLDVAWALRAEYGFQQFYVADLDAILHDRPNWGLYRQLIDDGCQLRIDAGVNSADQSLAIQHCGAEPIIGLESCPGPDMLSKIVSGCHGSLTFSLDLKAGCPLLPVGGAGWCLEPLQIVRQVRECGVTRLIVLDLADVGTSNGGQTEDLCRSILKSSPEIQLTCGGGVRGVDDLRRLRLTGAASVLVASALHDGRLSPQDVARACIE
ncbi:MAG: hisA/hisF family protein [Planctomycetes bacterium]|nr:hisA/hisF family protein [Planctomycetota bacterium]